MKKIAKMRIPLEKMDAINEVWEQWFQRSAHPGPWMATIYEDEIAFVKSKKVAVIEGESTVINPLITSIMEVLLDVRGR